jgi:hypothetical protein
MIEPSEGVEKPQHPYLRVVTSGALRMSDDYTLPSGVSRLVRTANAVAFGTSSRSNPGFFGARSAAMGVIPVTLSVATG